MTMKNANIVAESIVQTAVRHMVQMTTTRAPLSPPAVVARRGAAVPKKGREKGGTHMMTRYIALLTRDSVLVLHVFRMNVDVVFIGSLIPSNSALACR